MSEPVTVVGAGPSGLHCAATLLAGGRRVRLVDVGFAGAAAPRPDLDLNGLKRDAAGAEYLLGAGGEGVVLPDDDSEYYGFPPGKEHVFRDVPGFDWRASGFAPLFSFAAGGLAEAWTGGSYPFTRDEVASWPIDHAELLACYGEVARRIGISGAEDDLAAFYPLHDGLQPPVPLDAHSQRLLERYASRRDAIRRELRCHVGRARIATLSAPLGARPACHRCGRCLWGCPTGAFYTPSLTLAELRADARFEYLAGRLATHFRFASRGRVRELVVHRLEGGAEEALPVERLVLAAGTLASARIVLESIRRDSGERVALRGLMDNRQAMLPFVNTGLLGRAFEPASYQYNQLAVGFDPGGVDEYVHGLVTTLTTALVHPVVQALPFSLRGSLAAFRSLHAALGMINVNFSDRRRDENRVALEPDGAGGARLVIDYRPPADEPARVRRALGALRRLLWRLGCVAPPFVTRLRPMGASVHYAGTLPMSAEARPFTTDPAGRSREFENLWLADGSSFPTLPAKNLTFTLMANATRIARTLL